MATIHPPATFTVELTSEELRIIRLGMKAITTYGFSDAEENDARKLLADLEGV